MSDATTGLNPAFAQIDSLQLNGGPLIICDVDEVVLHFIEPLEKRMARLGMEFVDTRYRLTGNIRHAATQDLASYEEVYDLLHGFFDDPDLHQEPVPGASRALAELSRTAQVIMLTNMPARFQKDRERVLASNGVPYPVIVNEGAKGPAVSRLAERIDGPIIFLDDSPSNLVSVRDAVNHAHIIQFIADPRFFATAEIVDGAKLTSNCWDETHRFIQGILSEHMATR
ncbi:hypothetical protein [Breoghania sp.]|uniref:hypothetical protein n=1 Tax=Breoghania sp. TaxID=2065378 RepID=UPI002AA61D4A|nr:hypothetical protein [Breoghania sp.]